MAASRQPIRALLVDYGEVLCAAPDPTGFEAMARLTAVELERFRDAYWHLRPAYDRGELSGPTYWRLVAEELDTEIDAGLGAELVERDIALWAQLDEPMLAWVNDVAATGVPVGLLSNMVAEIGVHLRDTLRAFEHFTTVTYSYEVGLAKPDPEIYHRALESLGSLAGETLFVDDRVANVESAQALGLHAHRFLGRKGLVAEIERRYAWVSVPS